MSRESKVSNEVEFGVLHMCDLLQGVNVEREERPQQFECKGESEFTEVTAAMYDVIDIPSSTFLIIVKWW